MADEVELQPLLDLLQRSLVAPTRSAALLPSSSDLSFERTLSRSFARKLDSQSTRILSLAQSILSWTNESPIELDEDLIKDGEYSKITQTVEGWLEQADEQLDKHQNQGKYKPQSSGGGAVGAKTQEEMQEKSKNQGKLERLPAKLLHDSTLPKPQLVFTRRTVVQAPQVGDRSANDEGGIPLWKPILRRKLHPLNPESDESWLQTELYQPTSRFTSVTDTTPPAYTRYTHPYQSELASLLPPASLLSLPDQPKPIPKDSFEKTPFEWVGDEKALEKMIEEIRNVGKDEGMKELAVDLEHHDFRSWEGFTCLIQLSTRKKDYVIDAINPGVRENLEVLNEFFTDPTWIKVLHGANSDIVWLQRDFGLYVVGLFDTYHATHVLGYPQHSLASLLDMYTDFEPDKRYQLADWRIRPLPQEMLHYARSDTHYLLSIYDHLRLALQQKLLSSPPLDSSSPSPVVEVFQRSISVSQTTFSIPPFDHETGHFDTGFLIPLGKSGQIKAYSSALAVPTLPIKTGWGPGEVRLEVLRKLVRWREEVARKEDESTRFVMSLNGVLQVVEAVKRIVSENGGGQELIRVLGIARGGVSELVRKRKEEVVDLLRRTVEEVEGKLKDGEDVAMGDSTTMGGQGFMNGLAAFEPSVKPVKGLWESESITPIASSSSLSTSNSSFFGSSTAAPSNSISTPSLTTSSSSFFGPSSSSAAKKSGKNGKGKGKEVERSSMSEMERSEAVRKVHESLVLGGGLAKSLQPHRLPVVSPSTESPSAPTSNAMAVDPSTLPQQLPLDDDSFVPFSSTSSVSTTPAAIGSTSHSVDAPKKRDQSEVIVVSSLKDKPSRSSQQAQKKRRRGTASTSEPSELRLGQLEAEPVKEEEVVSPPPSAPPVKKQKKKKTSSSSSTPAEPITPHDYTGSSSILDAGPSILTGLERREAEKKQKKKDKIASGGTGKGFKVDTSEFKRPMRVDNAPKKANISRSFQS